jgi:hypothetical protein
MAHGSAENFYDLLEVQQDASPEDIRKSYKRLALRYHPDKNSSVEAEQKFKKISDAYQVLADDNKRRLYDQYGNSYQDYEHFGFSATLVVELFREVMYSTVTPFDTISRNCKVQGMSGFGAFKQTLSQHGIRGLWRGALMGMCAQLVYERTRNFLGGFLPLGTFDFRMFLLLTMRHCVSRFVHYPLEMVTTLHRTNLVPHYQDGFAHIWNFIKSRKLGYAWAGFIPFLVHDVVVFVGELGLNSNETNSWIADKLRKYLQDKNMGPLTWLGIMVAKCAALSLFTCPLKTVIYRMQAQTLINPQNSLGFFGTASSLVSQEGVSKLYKGFVADVLLAAGSALLSIFVT